MHAFTPAILLMALATSLASCAAQNPLQAASPSVVVNTGDWSYLGNTGPQFWGQLNPQYQACAAGSQQSPVDLSNCTTSPTGLTRPAITLLQSNLNFTAQVNNFVFECNNNLSLSCGNIVFNATTYQLRNVHFHAPSEHRLNGMQYPLEAHFVHRSSPDNSVAVLSVLFTTSSYAPSNKAVAALLAAAQNRTSANVNLSNLFPASSQLYTLTGSLTAPPCTGNVRWFVSSTPLTVSFQDILQYFLLVGGTTNRPLQPLNGRTVQCI